MEGMDPTDSVQASAGPAAPADRRRVLIADDNRDYADSLAEVLRGLGCEVVLCHEGCAALEAVRASAPEIGLFDLGMPGLDGYALATAVRRLPGGDRIVLVAVSGRGPQQVGARAQAAGFDQHWLKPVDIRQITQLLAVRSTR